MKENEKQTKTDKKNLSPNYLDKLDKNPSFERYLNAKGLSSIPDQVIYGIRPNIIASVVVDQKRTNATQPWMIDVVHLKSDGLIAVDQDIRLGEQHNFLFELAQPTSKSVKSITAVWNAENKQKSTEVVGVGKLNLETLNEFGKILDQDILQAAMGISSFKENSCFAGSNQSNNNTQNDKISVTETIKLFQNSCELPVSYYNFLKSSFTDEILKRRLEVAKAIPLFFVSQNCLGLKTNGLGHLVDLRYPIVVTVAYKTGLKPSVLKRYLNIKPYSGLNPVHNLNMFFNLQLADLLPENWIEKDVEVWNRIANLSENLKPLLQANNVTKNILKDSVLRVGQSFVSAQMIAESTPGLVHMRDCAFELMLGSIACIFKNPNKFPKRLTETIAAYNGWHQEAYLDNFSILLFANRSFRSAAQVSAKHLQYTINQAQAQFEEYEQNKLTLKPGQDWSAVFGGEPFIIDKYPTIEFVEQLSVLNLQQEGKEMNHCVGSYGGMCKSGLAHILSVRNTFNGERSTLHVNFRKIEEKISLEVVQHLGVKNARAPEENAQAVLDLKKQVANGKIPMNLIRIKQIMDAKNNFQYTTNNIMTILNNTFGQMWQTPKWREEWWDKWKDILNIQHTSPLEYFNSLDPRIWQANADMHDLGQAIEQINQNEQKSKLKQQENEQRKAQALLRYQAKENDQLTNEQQTDDQANTLSNFNR